MHFRLFSTDVVMAVWVAVWIWAGIAVHDGARDLANTTNRMDRIAGAVEETGRTIEELGGLPLLPDEVAQAGRDVREQAREVQLAAREGGESGRRVAVLLGFSVALIPTLPVLLLYLPRRIALERDRRALAKAPEELLALRARVHLPVDRVLAMGDDTAALAAAERRRLGLPSITES